LLPGVRLVNLQQSLFQRLIWLLEKVRELDEGGNPVQGIVSQAGENDIEALARISHVIRIESRLGVCEPGAGLVGPETGKFDLVWLWCLW